MLGCCVCRYGDVTPETSVGRLTMFIVLAFLFTTLPKMTERLRNVRSRALVYRLTLSCVYALLHSLVSGDTLLFCGSVTRRWAQP